MLQQNVNRITLRCFSTSVIKQFHVKAFIGHWCWWINYILSKSDLLSYTDHPDGLRGLDTDNPVNLFRKFYSILNSRFLSMLYVDIEGMTNSHSIYNFFLTPKYIYKLRYDTVIVITQPSTPCTHNTNSDSSRTVPCSLSRCVFIETLSLVTPIKLGSLSMLWSIFFVGWHIYVLWCKTHCVLLPRLKFKWLLPTGCYTNNWHFGHTTTSIKKKESQIWL